MTALSVVTGAARGIGRATATALARRGHRVALIGRSRESLLEVEREIAALGGEAFTFVADVAKSGDVHRAATSILSELGVPEAVVANAGIVRRARVEDTSDEDFHAVLDTNLGGTFFTARAFLPAMRSRGRGRFVAVASISATLGTARLSAYCASKWGTVGFVKSLAEELRGEGLQAMSVLPGSVDTRMLEGSGFAPQMSPEDVARTIVYCALDAPDAMNGSSVEVFGP